MGYFGSKAGAGVYQNIISLMPPHNVYIETHLGSGAILLKKPPAEKNIGIDIDPEVIKDFKKIIKEKKYNGNIELINSDSHKFLSSYDFTGKELVYIDPPYLHETRSSNHRYKYEYTKQQHKKLLKIIKSLPCNVILSGYPSLMYDEELRGWNTKTFQAMSRGGVRTEQVWFNYDLNSVFWSSFAGSNFTDRQRIKRKAERWAKNFAALPPGEKMAVLAALMEVDF